MRPPFSNYTQPGHQNPPLYKFGLQFERQRYLLVVLLFLYEGGEIFGSHSVMGVYFDGMALKT